MATETKKTKLNKQTIAAIADQVEARMRLDDSSQKRARKNTDRMTNDQDSHSNRGVFLWGAVSGLALAVAAPLLGKQARPAVRGAIKGGILASRYVQKVASGVKEDVQDLSAEAAAELDIEEQSPRGNARPKGSAN